MKTKTKTELQSELKLLKLKLEKTEKSLKSAKETNAGKFAYLFTIADASAIYLEELIKKTDRVRIVTRLWPDEMNILETRQFHDGNEVIIIYKNNNNSVDFKEASFWRKLG